MTQLLCWAQSFDVQRVLEGEKALRSDAARRLREVEKRLAVHRNPALILSSPLHAPGGHEDSLEQQRAQLQAAIRQHSSQVCLLLSLALWGTRVWLPLPLIPLSLRPPSASIPARFDN